MTFIFGGVRLLGFRVRVLEFCFLNNIHLLEIISDVLEIRYRVTRMGNLISSKSVKFQVNTSIMFDIYHQKI